MGGSDEDATMSGSVIPKRIQLKVEFSQLSKSRSGKPALGFKLSPLR
jgi:hypothetical protein